MNNEVLISFICALMHYDKNDVHTARITNPIILGDHLSDKDVILDVNVVFNNRERINIEMQVINEVNWVDRSLYCLCRNHSKLKKGEGYTSAMPTTQIGILDYTLFDDDSNFYSTYMFYNPKTGKIFSDKLKISVLNLKQIANATEEDRLYDIDVWAFLFKATTWEEIKMLATKNHDIEKAASSIYDLSADEAVMWECFAREDRLHREADRRKYEEELKKRISNQEKQLEANQKELDASQKELDASQKELDASQKELEAYHKELDASQKELEESRIRIAELEKQLEKYEKTV